MWFFALSPFSPPTAIEGSLGRSMMDVLLSHDAKEPPESVYEISLSLSREHPQGEVTRDWPTEKKTHGTSIFLSGRFSRLGLAGNIFPSVSSAWLNVPIENESPPHCSFVVVVSGLHCLSERVKNAHCVPSHFFLLCAILLLQLVWPFFHRSFRMRRASK